MTRTKSGDRKKFETKNLKKNCETKTKLKYLHGQNKILNPIKYMYLSQLKFKH